jgi:hypothetical protein
MNLDPPLLLAGWQVILHASRSAGTFGKMQFEALNCARASIDNLA